MSRISDGEVYRIDDEGSIIYMADVIAEMMGYKKPFVVHYFDGNPLNNTRENLRVMEL
jgi:hypothetical protein